MRGKVAWTGSCSLTTLSQAHSPALNCYLGTIAPRVFPKALSSTSNMADNGFLMRKHTRGDQQEAQQRLAPKPVIYTMPILVGLTFCPDFNKAPKPAYNCYLEIPDQPLGTKPQKAASSNLSKSFLSLPSGVTAHIFLGDSCDTVLILQTVR